MIATSSPYAIFCFCIAMRARIISRSRRAGRGIRGRRNPYGCGGGVSFGARIARRGPLEDEIERGDGGGMAASFVVTASVISPSGSVWTVTAPCCVELLEAAYLFGC